MNKLEKPFGVVIHGGAGTILKSLMTPQKELIYKQALSESLHAAYAILQAGGSSLDAVEAAVVVLENFPLFNAGKGSVFTNLGTHEMDASIMEGKSLMAGAVSGVDGIKNPICLARAVMEKSDHVYLSGKEAIRFGKLNGVQEETSEYFFEESRYQQWLSVKDSDTYQLDHSDSIEKGERKFGTVGAVALDKFGNLAAATSTGGMTNKKFGRIGDTPIIGAGTYANNQTCAISCTGHGEFFIRSVVAYDISCLVEYKGLSLQDAADRVVKEKLVKLGGEGGIIGIDGEGNPVFSFNSEGMYRGFLHSEKGEFTAIYG